MNKPNYTQAFMHTENITSDDYFALASHYIQLQNEPEAKAYKDSLNKIGVDVNKLPVVFSTDDLYHTEGIDDKTRKILSIQTYYESMWIERGLNIKYMKFQLPREGELKEPEVEIEDSSY